MESSFLAGHLRIRQRFEPHFQLSVGKRRQGNKLALELLGFPCTQPEPNLSQPRAMIADVRLAIHERRQEVRQLGTPA